MLVKLTAAIGSDVFSIEWDGPVDPVLAAFQSWLTARMNQNTKLEALAGRLSDHTAALDATIKATQP